VGASLRRGALTACAALAMSTLILICLGCGKSTEKLAPTPSSPPALTPANQIPGPLPTARPLGAEPLITQTTAPAIAALALRFQPTVEMSIYDRFWPVSVAAVLAESNHGRHTCLVIPGHGCGTTPVTLASLHANASADSYLQFPEPLNDVEDQFVGFEQGLGVNPTTIAHWKESPASLQPYSSAQIYFYDAERRPYPYPGVPRGLTSLQYWFFYPLNYYPTLVNLLGMLSDPLHSDYLNSDYHEGDWEHIAVLIDSSDRPEYLWMARHAKEGVAIPWSQVKLEQGHPVIYPALGGHPSYQACGAHRRSYLLYLFADYVPCTPGLFTFSPATTPLVDLSHASWACWPGHFGVAGAGLHSANNIDDPTGLVLVAGPPSPLRQAENAHAC
jgi:hypothetical protein